MPAGEPYWGEAVSCVHAGKSCGHVFGVNSNKLAAFLFPAHGMVSDALIFIFFRNCFAALFPEEESELQTCVHLIFVVFRDALQ